MGTYRRKEGIVAVLQFQSKQIQMTICLAVNFVTALIFCIVVSMRVYIHNDKGLAFKVKRACMYICTYTYEYTHCTQSMRTVDIICIISRSRAHMKHARTHSRYAHRTLIYI